MILRTIGLMLMFALTGASSAFVLDAATVARIEARIRLPPTAHDLGGYDRYYAPTRVSGRKMVVGLLLATSIADENDRYAKGDPQYWRSGPKRKGRVSILANEARLPPGIMDGGCTEIHVYWDIATEKIAGIFCNGYA